MTELPNSWKSLISESPAFAIHLDKHTDRLDNCVKRIADAGYKNMQLYPAVFCHDPSAWALHNVKFDGSWMVPRVAGCLLSHLGVWKKIIDENIPVATVFEDDVIFHSQWHELAEKYYDATQKSCDMIFMGHHCGNVYPNIHIVQVPVYCLNAYIVTLEGAQKLYQMITQYPYDDNHAIDMMLVRLMIEQLQNCSHPDMPQLRWLVWNTEMFPDPVSQQLIHPQLVHKDKGLVFQQQYP